MPTIDQLSPATAASDGDVFLISQHGATRKVTRAQVLAGVQPQIAVNAGTLLGRSSDGVGAPESISLGANISLTNGTLSASGTAFQVKSLTAGTVPGGNDLVPLGQDGTNKAVSYSQFMSGLASVSNVDASQLLVTPTGSKSPTKLADLSASSLPISGGTLTGTLTLAADPSASLHAATKKYVDAQIGTALPKSGGTLTGALVLAGEPSSSGHAATKQYVDGQVATALPKSGGTLTGAVTLPADPASALQAATKQYVDGRVSRNGDTMTGALTLPADPTAPLQAATKSYVDGQAANSLGKSGGTLTGPLTLAADPSALMHAATKRYVDIQTATALPLCGGTLTGALALPSSPTAAAHAASKQYVDAQTATALPLAGGVLSGALTLSSDPTSSLHAVTKRYVDSAVGVTTGVINVKSAPYNATLNGKADDTAAFKAAYQAAAAGSVIYVPNGVAVLQNPGAWGIPLTKRVRWAVDGVTLTDGSSLANAIPGGTGPANNFLPGVVVGNSQKSAEISQNGSQPDDFAVLHTSYIVAHAGGPTGGSVATNTRADTIIYDSPNNYIWGGLDRLLWCGTQTPSAAARAEHVGRYVQTIRQSIGTDSSGKALPQPNLWAACLEYRDTTGRPSSWGAASITVEMDWIGNGPDDAYQREIQSLVVSQHDTSGAPVEVSTILGVWLAVGSKGHAHRVFNVNIPFSTSVLDTTGAQQLTGAAAIRLAAGHSIAFEPTNTCRLAYDAASNTLRWYQGALSYPLGKGITVGWVNVFGANATLPNYLSGNIIFLTGSGSPYTITLPSALTVAAGTGFTFSVLGSANVTIAPAGTEYIDNGPVVLRPNDRYHIISDASSAWHEVFRTNAVNPKFSAPPVFPSYAVASLPTSPGAGAKAFASNGRKPSEAAGAGTGVEVFYDGARWISVCSGTQVAT